MSASIPDAKDHSAETAAMRAPNRVKAIMGACSGNLVEWYDFFIYAYTAIYFAASFFPKGDTTSQLLATASVSDPAENPATERAHEKTDGEDARGRQ